MENRADVAEKMFSMEQDAREIADRIQALAVRMEQAGLPAASLLPAMVEVCTVGATFAVVGELYLHG